MGLKEEYDELKEEYLKLTERGRALTPQVLEHFNRYLRDELNPILPSGYSIEYSEPRHVYYSNGGFSITTGRYITPHGITKGPLELETFVLKHLINYVEANNWVNAIHEGFVLSK